MNTASKWAAVGLATVVSVAALPVVSGLAAGEAFRPQISLFVGIANAQATGGAPIDRTFSARRMHVDRMVARIEMVTSPGQQVRVQATGKPEALKNLQVHTVGDELVLRLDRQRDEAWFPWNLFNLWSKEERAEDVQLRITLPAGMPIEIEDMVGSVVAGDLDSPLSLEGASVTGRFGRLQSAKVGVAGSGNITLGAIREGLDIELAGSGRVNATSAASAKIEIAGAGDVTIGSLAAGLDAEIYGGGNIRLGSLAGPVDIEIAGSGSVLVDSGQATALKVEIAGSGDVVFKGHATNPSIDIYGSGSVTLGSYSGSLNKDISGSGDVRILSPAAPQAPSQPSTPSGQF